ncbi:MAG: ABC transporter permease [Oceanicaulis sp.]
MGAVLIAELVKLKRSLVLLLIAGAAGMILVMLPAVIVTGNAPDDWMRLSMSGAAIWAYLLMPLTATALTALAAGIEHQNQGWTWTLALPAPKPAVFAAKAVIAALAMAGTGALVGGAILAGGLAGSALAPQHALSGAPPAAFLAELLAKMWLAGLLALAIQFFAAHVFRSFAVPIVVGIAGTFVSVVATSAQLGIYFPWLLPVNMLASEPERAMQALLTGSVGGVAVFALAIVWLSRKDWR